MKIIPVSRGLEVLIDDCDFDAVTRNKWCTVRSADKYTWYATRSIKIGDKWKHIKMHRFIMDAPQGVKVDHRDGNGLNNQRSNLRLCTHAQNLMNMRIHNKHGCKGVAYIQSREPRPWLAKIHVNGKLKTIGLFATLIEAASAYNEWAMRYFGEFARLNDIKQIRPE